MHSLAVALAPVIAAEKSKVPFYIAGGVLVVWALVVSMGIGMRNADFPGSVAAERGVIAITAVLVLVAVSTAVITSEAPAHKVPVNPGESIPPTAPPPVVGQPVATTASASSSESGSSSSSGAGTSTGASSGTPAATTGTPAPASSPAAKGAATSLSLAANPSGLLSYNTKQLSAKAGTITITMANMSPVEHNVTIAEGKKVLGATPTFTGGTRQLKVTLKPGTYTFYCSVPGHREAGMEGTLTVS
jgi:plastocyanin